MAAVVGHNSVAGDQLRTVVERIERLEDEKKNVTADIKDVYAEAKGNGFDAKTLRKIVALRKLDEDKRKEAQAMLDLYAHALGLDLV
jgi:uncharacterized protein (UPF0335 family)